MGSGSLGNNSHNVQYIKWIKELIGLIVLTRCTDMPIALTSPKLCHSMKAAAQFCQESFILDQCEEGFTSCAPRQVILPSLVLVFYNDAIATVCDARQLDSRFSLAKPFQADCFSHLPTLDTFTTPPPVLFLCSKPPHDQEKFLQ